MFQLLEFCDTIQYHDLILSSEFRMIKDCFIKGLCEEHMIGGFWTDLGILYLWSFSNLTTHAVY